jgi:hypothetical protein
MGWLGTCTTPLLTADQRARARAPRLMGQTLFGMLVGALATGGVAFLDAGFALAGLAAFGGALLVAALALRFRPQPGWAHP